ncbi:unnamed protein product [Lampetra fluviatilis]
MWHSTRVSTEERASGRAAAIGGRRSRRAHRESRGRDDDGGGGRRTDESWQGGVIIREVTDSDKHSRQRYTVTRDLAVVVVVGCVGGEDWGGGRGEGFVSPAVTGALSPLGGMAEAAAESADLSGAGGRDESG